MILHLEVRLFIMRKVSFPLFPISFNVLVQIGGMYLYCISVVHCIGLPMLASCSHIPSKKTDS